MSMNRRISLGIAVGILLALAGGLAHSAATLKVAALLPGSAGDQSWNSYGYGGLERIEGELGAEIAFSENVPSAEQVTAFRDYARKGFDVVFGHSGRFLDAAMRVAHEFPDTRFIVAAGTAGNGKNVDSVDVARDQFAYVEGVIAGRMTKTNKVGVVAGLEGLLAFTKTVGGFRQGVEAVNPGAQVNVIWLQSIEDVALAKEAAYSLAQWGADVVLGILNRGHIGLIEAAKENKIYTVGRTIAHTELAPEYVLTSTVEDWPSIYLAMASLHKEGKLKGEARVFGFDTPLSQGAKLLYRDGVPYNPALPTAVREDAERVIKELATGKLKLNITREDARGGT